VYEPPRYLAWALANYVGVKFDLATSGMLPVPVADLASAPALAALDDATGWVRLRAAIARYNGVPEQESIAALGTAHALWLAYAALTSPGDEILVEEPAYEPLLRAATGVGARVVRFARDPAQGFALDPSSVARAMTPRTRLVAVTNLHNPSGARASDDVLREIARLAAARQAFLLVDEVYAPFDDLVGDDGVFRGSARRLGSNVVCASSLTKCYGLGAHRFGWLTGPRDAVAHCEATILSTCGILPLAHANLALAAFADIAALATRARGVLAGKRAIVDAWARSRPEIAWSAPGSGLFGFARIPGRGRANLLADIERGIAEQEVIVAPGSFFETPDGFRLAWGGIALEDLPEALARLEKVLGLTPA
jgi:aspartate/methionine/tyrosine aminotransferase